MVFEHRDAPFASINQEARLQLESWQTLREREGAPLHLSLALRLGGPIEIDGVRDAVRALGTRHDILRTAFQPRIAPMYAASIRERPRFRQIVDPEAELQLGCVDLSDGDRADQPSMLDDFAGEEIAKPFDYATAPLARVTLFRLGDAEHVLLFVLHHLVGDGWSLMVLKREFEALYGQRSVSTEACDLPERPTQYADFADWQRKHLQGVVLEQHLEFWRAQAERWEPAATRVRDLPFARLSVTGGIRSSALSEVIVDGGTADGLRAIGKHCNTTLYVVCLAALQAALGACTGRTAIAIQVHFANRMQRRFVNMVGWCATRHLVGTENTLDASGMELIEQSRSALLAASAHQDVPSSVLWDEVMRKALAQGDDLPEMHAAESITFDMVTDRPSLAGRLEINRIECRPRKIPAGRASLAFTARDCGSHVALRASYDAKRFDGPQVAAFLSEWREVLNRLAITPSDAPARSTTSR